MIVELGEFNNLEQQQPPQKKKIETVLEAHTAMLYLYLVIESSG